LSSKLWIEIKYITRIWTG